MATGSRLAGVAEWPITPEMSGNPGPSSHAQAKGTTSSGRLRRGVNRPDDAPARPAQECGLGATARKTRPLVATGNPCASRMIPLESPVPEIGTPGSESGGRKRTHGVSACGPARKRRKCHRPPTGHAPPLDSTNRPAGRRPGPRFPGRSPGSRPGGAPGPSPLRNRPKSPSPRCAAGRTGPPHRRQRPDHRAARSGS